MFERNIMLTRTGAAFAASQCIQQLAVARGNSQQHRWLGKKREEQKYQQKEYKMKGNSIVVQTSALYAIYS